jgi:hypothetical protein
VVGPQLTFKQTLDAEMHPCSLAWPGQQACSVLPITRHGGHHKGFRGLLLINMSWHSDGSDIVL